MLDGGDSMALYGVGAAWEATGAAEAVTGAGGAPTRVDGAITGADGAVARTVGEDVLLAVTAEPAQSMLEPPP